MTRVPKHCRHKPTDQGYVRLDGKMIYTGKWGTAAAEARYRQLLAEYLATGRTPASGAQNASTYTLECLMAEFLEWAQGYYRREDGSLTHECVNVRYALKPLRTLFPRLAAAEFSPNKLRAYQYAVERAARERGLDDEARRELRQAEAAPRLEALELWLARMRPTVLDKSPMAKAIDYVRANWDALVVYVTDGRLEIDNNRAERALRAVVTGRKNWLFVGNEGGGRTAAVLYSVVQTCKELGVDPRQYLSDALVRLKQGGDPAALTPHAWKEHYADELVQDRAWVLAQLRGKDAAAQ